jgi:hypothetical protein
MDLKPFQSQPHSQPAGEIVDPAPLIHDGITNTPRQVPHLQYPRLSPPNATEATKNMVFLHFPPSILRICRLPQKKMPDTSSPIDKRMQGTQEQGHKVGDHHDWLR